MLHSKYRHPPERAKQGTMRRGDLEELLIEVGLEILIDEGVATGTERLTFKRVFDRAAAEHQVYVTNASVIGRIWDDMAEYQAAVLAAVLTNDDEEGLEDTINVVAKVLVSADLSTSASRVATLTEVIRAGCEAHIDALTSSRKSSLHMGLRRSPCVPTRSSAAVGTSCSGTPST